MSPPETGETPDRAARILESITDALYTLDREWRFTYLNERAAELMAGVAVEDREDLLGETIWSKFPQLRGSIIEAEYRRALRRETTALFEYHDPSGEAWYEVRAYPSEQGLVIHFHDISSRKRVQEELERSRQLLEESQRSAHVGSWEWDALKDAITWSDELYRIFGLEPDGRSMSFERYLQLLHPGDRQRVGRTIQRALKNRESFTFDHRVTRPDGELRVVHCRGRVITDENDEVARMIGSAQDITERKRKEERDRFLAEASHLLSSSLGYERTLRQISELAVPRVADWAGVDVLQEGEIRRLAVAHSDPEREELATEVSRRWPPAPDETAGVARVLRTGEPEFIPEVDDELLESVARTPEHLRVLRELGLRSAMIVPMNARGRTVGSIAFIAAESGRTYTEDDLAFARELAHRAALAVDNARLFREAREASRARDDLLAIVSHDLRNPLNTIVTAAELLLDSGIAEKQKEEQARAIRRSAERMDRLTADLLDVTRIEEGRLAIQPSPHDLSSIVGQAIASWTHPAGEKDIRLTTDIPPEVSPVHADRERLIQVLENLIGNAVEHTPVGGRIAVTAMRNNGDAEIRVSDTGPGIPRENLPNLFDRFWQAENSDGAGAGLGLAIARGIVEAHGGRIWVDEVTDPGATFRFTVPLAGTGAQERSPVE